MNFISFFIRCVSSCLLFCSLGMCVLGDEFSTESRLENVTDHDSVEQITISVKKAESLWPTDRVQYLRVQNYLGSILERLSSTNIGALEKLKTQCQVTLDKPCPTNPAIAVECFKLKESIVNRTIRISEPNIQCAQDIATFLGQIRSATIHDYKRMAVSMNVMPPILPKPTVEKKYTFIAAGMDPNAISDPVARKAYENAIEENHLRGKQNELQLDILPELNHTMTETFFSYVKRIFESQPVSKEEIENLEKSAYLTDTEQKQFQQYYKK